MKNSQLGIKNHHFKGYYITPWGKFESSENPINISSGSMKLWCKNSNKIINKKNISHSKYLQSLKESPSGKTFKEIGFNFIPQ